MNINFMLMTDDIFISDILLWNKTFVHDCTVYSHKKGPVLLVELNT